MKERLSRLGAWIGNWNDRLAYKKAPGAPGVYHGGLYRRVDRFAGWLYTLPERGPDGVRR